ncbi:hypothetical protein J4Q44_G00197090 [Coregonus suidteri]|uniref:General transcription factor IIF subunit 2 n=1 Tax=Coregonus suidteri TaxID=861788 RepID=A0AAN8QSV7_9TELE
MRFISCNLSATPLLATARVVKNIIKGSAAMSEKTEVDLTGAKQNTGVWLVKVPKYLAQQWAKAPGKGEIGKLKIVKIQGKADVLFTLNEDLTSLSAMGEKAASVRAPRDHPFTMHSVGGQTLAVFTETSADKISLEGIVVQRAECRPAVNQNYMKLKKLQIEVSTKPQRLTEQMDKAVTNNFKPVSNHVANVEYLVVVTKQPVTYLKEILREIGVYNAKGTHKSTWELKPEYRHYQGGEEEIKSD